MIHRGILIIVAPLVFLGLSPTAGQDDAEGLPLPRRPAAEDSRPMRELSLDLEEHILLTYGSARRGEPVAERDPEPRKPEPGNSLAGKVKEVTETFAPSHAGDAVAADAGAAEVADPAAALADLKAREPAEDSVLLMLRIRGVPERQGEQWVVKLLMKTPQWKRSPGLPAPTAAALAEEANALRDGLREWSVPLTAQQVAELREKRHLLLPLPQPFSQLRLFKAPQGKLVVRPPGARVVNEGSASTNDTSR